VSENPDDSFHKRSLLRALALSASAAEIRAADERDPAPARLQTAQTAAPWVDEALQLAESIAAAPGPALEGPSSLDALRAQRDRLLALTSQLGQPATPASP
jgi:uncharacterized protein involved in exopolysaccharide biosynthesis